MGRSATRRRAPCPLSGRSSLSSTCRHVSSSWAAPHRGSSTSQCDAAGAVLKYARLDLTGRGPPYYYRALRGETLQEHGIWVEATVRARRSRLCKGSLRGDCENGIWVEATVRARRSRLCKGSLRGDCESSQL